MRLLHTSDWHLGRMLYSKKDRNDEQAAFLKWLLANLMNHSVDLLIIAGDIFDTATPGNNTQKMYYDFLLKVRDTGCQNIIIVGGNHDSPSFLNAPKEILAAINVCVIGNASENPEDEVIVVKGKEDDPTAIVCAVPFLRERDISHFIEGESYSDRSQRMAEKIRKHYEKVAEIAAKKTELNITERAGRQKKIPVIATGHLSVAGGKTIEDDGVRDLYIGNIECIGSDIFSPIFDYVALGHYHIASVIDKNVRYSGSPIPMGFGEANQKKSVYIVEFNDITPTITTLEIPVFQQMESIRGDKTHIFNRLEELKKTDNSVWVEIIYDANDIFSDLSSWADEMTTQTKIEIIKFQNRQYLNEVLTQNDSMQSLDNLDKFEVFDILLEKNNFPTEKKAELQELYQEITLE